ncbi:MAG: HU family DNA-binding protein, partial [Acidimicrobiaceae bacterium]|nr:HU family DNA-binding protein [Acidimicrobiaceae bacterium]
AMADDKTQAPLARSRSRKIVRREIVREIALQFRQNLPERSPSPKMVTQGPRNSVAHYELAGQAIAELIDMVGDALSEARPIVLRGFGQLLPKQYKPMTVRLPGARPDDKNAVFSVPVRMGVIFRPSPKLKKEIRAYDEEHGL